VAKAELLNGIGGVSSRPVREIMLTGGCSLRLTGNLTAEGPLTAADAPLFVQPMVARADRGMIRPGRSVPTRSAK
jgi:hypothetical protein